MLGPAAQRLGLSKWQRQLWRLRPNYSSRWNDNYDDLGLYQNREAHAGTGLQPRFAKRRVEAADPAFLSRDAVACCPLGNKMEAKFASRAELSYTSRFKSPSLSEHEQGYLVR